MSSYTTVNKTPSSCRLRGESTVEVKLKVQLCFLLNADVSMLTSSHVLSSSPFVRKVDVWISFPVLGLEVKCWIVSNISKKTSYFTLKKLIFLCDHSKLTDVPSLPSSCIPSLSSLHPPSFPSCLEMNLSYWLLKLVWLESHAGQRSFDETLDVIRLLHFLSACSLVPSFPSLSSLYPPSFPSGLEMNYLHWFLIHMWLESHAGQRSFDGIID